MAISKNPFKIDGVAIPTPSDYKFSVEDLSSEMTGRTLDGKMHKDVVSVKDTYACVWKKASWEDAATLLKAVDGKTKVKFTHADPRVPNTFITGDFYIGKRECKAVNLSNPQNTWAEITLSFIRI
jgi:hypothetical protein